jgi:maltooligosyltrehalose trehalohydrolase
VEQVFENFHPQCGAIVQSDGSVRWRVWAPKADRVEVVLINGDARTLHRMTRGERGFFSFVKDHVLN